VGPKLRGTCKPTLSAAGFTATRGGAGAGAGAAAGPAAF